MEKPIRVLHLEDNPRDAELIQHTLKADGLACDIVLTQNREGFETALAQDPFDLILSDYKLPDYDGLSALKQALKVQPDVPVIIISGTLGEEQAVDCLKLGATDFVLKQRTDRLVPSIKRALAEAEEHRQRQDAEKALRKSEAEFRSTLEDLLVGVLVHAADSSILLCNPQACRILGLSREQMVGKLAFDPTWHVMNEDLSVMDAGDYPVSRVIATGKSIVNQVLGINRPDRPETTWLTVSATPVFTEENALSRIIVNFMDITERKEAEKKIALEQNLFLSLMDNISAHVYFKDLDSRFIRTNQTAASLFGMEKMALIGKSDFDFFPKEAAEKQRRDEERVMQTRQPIQIVEHHQDLWTLTTKAPRYDQNGKLAGTFGVSLDITDQKIAEQALEASRRLLRNVLDTIPARVWWKDLNSKFLGCNLHFSHDAGLDHPRQLIGKTDYDMCWKEQADHFVSDDREMIESGKPMLGIEEFQTQADGKIHRIETNKIPLRNNEGEIIGTVGSYSDITERKKLEARLRQTQFAVDHLADAAYWCTEDGRFAYVNEASCLALGYTEEELLNLYIYDVDLDASVGTWPDFWHSFKQSGRARIERTHRRKDGSSFPVEVRINYLEFEEIGLACGFAHNITDKKIAEAERRRLSTAIEQSPETVMITDPDGIIQYVNPAFETITGYSSEEAIGNNPRFLQSGEHNEFFYSELWNTLTSGTPWAGRFINKRKDGTLYTEEAVISQVKDPTGAIINYVGVKRDITEELSKEEQFQQAQKMEAVGQMAGGIAHDFNNILQIILLFDELLMDELPAETKEHRNAKEIKTAAERAVVLTRQLLTFSRKQPAHKTLLILSTVIEESKGMLLTLLDHKTKLVLDLAQDLTPVDADAGQLSQLIMNLTVNARDAMPEGGRLTLSTENIRLTPPDTAAIPRSKPGNYVCLSITDTGQGMSQQVQDHLFAPFFTTKEVGKGTGLGLAVVYGIVEGHHGWINVYSEEGQGTSFKIYLPVHQHDPEPDALGEFKSEEAHHKRILLVEDDADMRDLVIHLLQGGGYQVSVAETTEEALVLFDSRTEEFNMLFSDIVLPKQSGIELADILREKVPSLPVLLYSGYRDQKERWCDLDSKGYHFLQKPFTITALMMAVHETLIHTDKK